MDFIEKSFDTIRYIIRYPEGYKEGEKYPVIIYLHGAGGRGDDINVLKKHTFFSITAEHKDFPFVCVTPLCYANTWFDIFEKLQNFAQHISESEFCDASRLYLMGASMGGYTTWQLGMSRPDLFAAIVPICGGGMNWNVGRLVNVPVWAFHGEVDQAVYLCESEMMVNRLKDWGASPKLTVYPGVAHNAWEPTFRNPEVFEWLLSHRNKNEIELKDTYKDAKKFG